MITNLVDSSLEQVDQTGHTNKRVIVDTDCLYARTGVKSKCRLFVSKNRR